MVFVIYKSDELLRNATFKYQDMLLFSSNMKFATIMGLSISFFLAIILAISTLPEVSANPWYSQHCVGCAGNYYSHHPYTQYYSVGSTYGYYGWDNYQVSYNYRFPYYQHYYSYAREYPYSIYGYRNGYNTFGSYGYGNSGYRGATYFYGHPYGGGRFW